MVTGYAPTSASTEEEYDEFLADTELLLSRTPRGFTSLLLGDFNSKVERDDTNSDIVGIATLHPGNNRGKLLVELCRAHKLRIWSTTFEKDPKRLWTWRIDVLLTKSILLLPEDRYT